MLTSKVALHNNSPAIFVNGAPILPGMAIGADNFAVADGFAEAGLPIYQSFYRDCDPMMGWDGEFQFDYSEDEKLFAEMLDYNPDALLLPIVGYLNKPPRKWMENHIKEMTILNTSRYGLGPSPASEIFTRESEEAIGRYIRHFEQSVFRDNIIGYHVINGRSFEWLAWDWFRPDIIGFDDYSQPMIDEFRRWLRQKYANDVAVLRDAWKDSSVSFEAAPIPTVEQRMGNPGSVLPGADDGLQGCDYHTCYAETWVKQTKRFCHAAKEAVGHAKIIAVFNGYNKIHCHDTYLQCVGHLAFEQLLESPCVDVIMGPYSYENRGIDGCHFPQVCESSFALHGKVFMEQIDTRTAIVTPRQPQWGQPDTVAESVEIMKRDMGTIITHGLAVQYFDMKNAVSAWGGMKPGPHWYDHPELKTMQIALTGLVGKAMHEDNRSTAEIAVFIDNRSYLLQRLNRGFGSLYITAQLQYEFDKISAPFDCYLLEDLPHIRDYKFYVFLNAFDLSEEVVAAIRGRVYEKGATALYFYAPACYHQGKLDLAGGEERIGIALGMEDSRDFIHTEITNTDHCLTKTSGANLAYGSEIDPEYYQQTTAYFPTNKELFRYSPIFFGADPAAKTLGILRVNQQSGLCVKEWNNGTVVYSAAPMMPAKLIRNIAAHAKVHLYTDQDDLVYANHNYLFITSRTDGGKQIHLPRVCDVADALTEKHIGKKVCEVSVKMKKNETRIFKLT